VAVRRGTTHSKHLKSLLHRSRVSDFRSHNLRHTSATRLLTKGVQSTFVSEMLGHSSIAITLDTYNHVIPGMGVVAAKAMEDALGE
jgi:integrase